MKKIAVVGCKGMAGHVVKTYLENIGDYDVWGIARDIKPGNNLIILDITNIEELEYILNREGFDIVINCIGILNEKAEENSELAIWLNSYLPQLLVSCGEKYDFKLIHISTDCVFSGAEGGYQEDSVKDGEGFYAKSKSLGEVINNKDLTFRTSIIGPELSWSGIGLFNWFMKQDTEIQGFCNAYWTGVTTLELAEGIDQSIKQDLKGLYHFVNGQKISKFDLLKMLNQSFRDNKIKIIEDNKFKIDKSLICTRDDFDHRVPSYSNMIFKMKEWMLVHNQFYQHYEF